MNTAIGTILITLTVLVTLWVVVFGTAGAMLSRHSPLSRPIGFLLGSLLGPLGLLIIWLRGRRHHAVSMVAYTTTTSVVTTSPAPTMSGGSDDSFSI